MLSDGPYNLDTDFKKCDVVTSFPMYLSHRDCIFSSNLVYLVATSRSRSSAATVIATISASVLKVGTRT
ncbi:hypothetical protein DPMN_139466 [Dreissena polymorpha]|uniref:Uncharacterized protein n=1 Tax=Dreissena polymorpha TaxID=45954 RepID=A0A9D4G8M9_DREPO|nr:hypothetical protein DPMN_139466 [Dreissena polymorpha]